MFYNQESSTSKQQLEMPSVLDEHATFLEMDKATIDHFPRKPSGMQDALNDDTLDDYEGHL